MSTGLWFISPVFASRTCGNGQGRSYRLATSGRMNIMKLSMSVRVSSAAILISSTAIAAEPAWQAAVERGAKTAATTSDDGVVRIGWQRTDVPVRVDGVPLPGG